MPFALNFNDPNVKRAARHDALQGKVRIGRGMFCAVYDNGDTVLKFTCDGKAYSYATDYCAPKGEFFPTLVNDYGDIGEDRHGNSLYLIEVEKLSPLRTAPRATKKLARTVLTVIDEHYHAERCGDSRSYAREDEKHRRWSYSAMLRAYDDARLPFDVREALYQVGDFISNYECGIDFMKQNLMVRGEQLVFNDVIADHQHIRTVQRRHTSERNAQRRIIY